VKNNFSFAFLFKLTEFHKNHSRKKKKKKNNLKR